MGQGIFQTANNSSSVTRSITLQYGNRHNQSIRIGTDNADSITLYSSGNTGTMGTVTVPVTQSTGLVHTVPAVQVVSITVLVVVFSISTSQLFLIGPDIVFQVGVTDIYTCVKDGNNGATS